MKIQVKVKTNSKVEEVIVSANEYIVKVKEPPREGKANKAAIRLLAGHFKVPQSSVKITSGLTSKNKVAEID